MAKRNIFEMLGLEFDPPDNVKKIRAAYENWRKRLTAEQNTTVDPLRLAVIRAELQMDEYISVMIDNPRFRQQEAESLKRQRVEELRLYIDIQRGDTPGTLQVNQAQIRQVQEKLRLNRATIEATYREQGFEIKPAKTAQKILATLNNFFMADSVLEELEKNFETFRAIPDEKNFPWAANVFNLYELAFYLENRKESSPEFYQIPNADEMHEIFRDAAKKFSAPIPQWQAIKTLLNLAQTQIFNSDDNRFKYAHSLKIADLADFFAQIKSAPEVFKRDRHFADNCIERIRKKIHREFPGVQGYEMACALYNKAAGLLRDPYEATLNEEENSFGVTCANCGGAETFRTREEIERARCKICGENFFVECPKCGKKIPATADHCAACKFSFAELKNFSAYVDEANSMLDLVEQSRTADEDVHIVTAKVVELLAKARLLKPEAADLKKLEWRINKISAELKKRDLYAWAEKKLPSLSIAPEKAVSDCIEILRKLKDYRPAQERLKLIVPKAPPILNLTFRENYSSASPSPVSKISVKAKSGSVANASSNLLCNVVWQVPNDLGLTYTLIRKAGGVPKNFRDGEILIERTDRTEFSDMTVKPGVLYGYAIFSSRLGTLSAPTTATGVHYSDLDEKKLIAKTENGACKFVWRLPSENCLGVRILRSDSSGKSVVVADCVQALPFVDKAVKNRRQYQYRLQCVYNSAEDELNNDEKFFSRQSHDEALRGVWNIDRTYKYSHGLTVTLTPEQPPKILENLTCGVRGGKISFRWKSTGDFSVWFKEVTKDADFDKKIFALDKIDELLGSGVVFKRAESSDEACDFQLGSDVQKIAVLSATRELGLVNEIFTCANVEPCEIDADKTQIDAGGLRLVLKSVPENLYQIHYKITTRDADELYATIDTAKARQMNRITATKYEQDKFIFQPHLPPKEIFITVIGEYKFSDGSSAYSTPATLTLNNRPKEIISYRLEWGTSGFFTKEIHAKDCKLIIESGAPSTPKMFLVCRRDGRMNIELNDAQTRRLGTVREYPEGYGGGRLEIDLPNDTWKDIAAGTVVKLLTSKEDERRFELKASRPDSLTVPKK